jgi:hypothetical protein
MADVAPLSDITFINCSRSPTEIIFRTELEQLSRFMPNLDLGFIVEGCGGTDLWSGLKGRIDKAKIALLSPDFMERTIFCCGPQVFMDAVYSKLAANGFDMARYHQESFQPAQAPTPLAEVSDEAPRAEARSIRFTMAGKDAVCASSETILQAARGAGVRIGAALRIRSLRHLPRDEADGRGRDGPRWRHSRRRDQPGLHPCLLLAAKDRRRNRGVAGSTNDAPLVRIPLRSPDSSAR